MSSRVRILYYNHWHSFDRCNFVLARFRAVLRTSPLKQVSQTVRTLQLLYLVVLAQHEAEVEALADRLSPFLKAFSAEAAFPCPANSSNRALQA